MRHPHTDNSGNEVTPDELTTRSITLALWLQHRILTTDPRDDASCVIMEPPAHLKTVRYTGDARRVYGDRCVYNAIDWRWLRVSRDSEHYRERFFLNNAVRMIECGGTITRAGLNDGEYDLGAGLAPYTGNGGKPWRRIPWNENVPKLMIAERLRLGRIEVYMRLRPAAKALGITPHHLSDIEWGRTSPSSELRERMEAFYTANKRRA